MANEFTARVAGISVELGMSVQNKSGIWCKPNGYEYHRSSGYGRNSLYLEPYTEERGKQVIQENKRKCMVGWLKEFDYTKLSYEEAEQVYTLVAGLKNS